MGILMFAVGFLTGVLVGLVYAHRMLEKIKKDLEDEYDK